MERERDKIPLFFFYERGDKTHIAVMTRRGIK
jgi:hypothetical protein